MPCIPSIQQVLFAEIFMHCAVLKKCKRRKFWQEFWRQSWQKNYGNIIELP